MKIGDGGVVMFLAESSSDLLHRVTQHSLAGGISQNALPTSKRKAKLPAFHLRPAIFTFCPVQLLKVPLKLHLKYRIPKTRRSNDSEGRRRLFEAL